MCAIGALTIFASGAATAGIQAAAGPAGTGLVILVFVILGNSASGGPFARPLLPGLWRTIGGVLPPGASVDLSRSALFFGGARIAGPILVLVGWAALGTAARPRAGRSHHGPGRCRGRCRRGSSGVSSNDALRDAAAATPGFPVAFETLNVRREGGVLFAEIAAPPMNLLGPELVRDLVSLIQRAEADDAVRVLVFTSADPDYFISHVDLTRDRRVPGGGGEADRRGIDRAAVSLSEREPACHDRADRGSGSRRGQRVRSGLRHALRGARVGDLRSVRAGVRSAPGRGRCPAPHAPDGSRASAGGDVERRGLRRRAGGALRLDQPRAARRRACGVRQLARSPDRRVSGRRPGGGQGAGQRDRARARSRIFVATPISSARRCVPRTPRG